MLTNITGFIENIDGANAEEYGIYPASLHYSGDAAVFMAKTKCEIVLVAEASLQFIGEPLRAGGKEWSVCRLTHENACRLRELFSFTRPSPVLSSPCSAGVGDRLGIATAGHIRAFEKYENISPVFAQQSIRELTLTNRSFLDVIDSASFAVFRENFTRPFGADGDHLKTFDEIEKAIFSGCTMITLDCSEHIFGKAAHMDKEELAKNCLLDSCIEEEYLNTDTGIEGLSLCDDRYELMRCVLLYSKAIEFASAVYERFFRGKAGKLELELSIDETDTPTSPFQHYFVAKELQKRDIKVTSLAPRFCGEFQKGVDYRGDIAQFEHEFVSHRKIANHFGYKISVHSGSDKFSVFPIIAKHCGGCFHIKTAGTNWLEAMALVAQLNPDLYRSIHAFALESFGEARKYYHVSCCIENIPALDSLRDEQLAGLFEIDDARQLIHITYGLILNAKNHDGSFRFRDKLYQFWFEYEKEYERKLEKHIGRHFGLLCSQEH